MTKPKPSAAQKLVGDIEPKLAELTDDVLFGDVWARPGLARRDRSLMTAASLMDAVELVSATCVLEIHHRH